MPKLTMRNPVFMARLLKDAVNSNPYEQLMSLSNDELRKEALSVSNELYRDKTLTQYQFLLIRMAIEAGQ